MSTKPPVPSYNTDEGPSSQGPSDGTFSPQVRYAGANVMCANCQYFDGTVKCSNQAVIADQGGNVEPGGRCEEFSPSGAAPDSDALSQSLAESKPFGAAPMGGMSNS